MRAVFERTSPRVGNARQRWRVALFVLMFWPCFAPANPPANAPTKAFSGLVSIADGDPFTIIRHDKLWMASAGVTLLAGDIVETAPDAFVVIEMGDGSLVGIGPSSWVYLLQRTDVPTVVVLKGWVKADIGIGAAPQLLRVVGTRAGVQSQKAAVILLADERADTIFDEQQSATLLLRDDAATHTDKETQPGQFFVRETHQAVVMQPRPSAEFISRMPIAFRDSLPPHASARLKEMSEPRPVRDVTYADVQPWLTMPRDWRVGFIGRFGGRLKDPAFRSALDAHMVQHPEWDPILHPPPPEDDTKPSTARPKPAHPTQP
jgi:hypothetical protein